MSSHGSEKAQSRLERGRKEELEKEKKSHGGEVFFFSRRGGRHAALSFSYPLSRLPPFFPPPNAHPLRREICSSITINTKNTKNRDTKSREQSSTCSPACSLLPGSFSSRCCSSRKSAAGTSPRGTRPPGGSGGSPRGPKRVRQRERGSSVGERELERERLLANAFF